MLPAPPGPSLALLASGLEWQSVSFRKVSAFIMQLSSLPLIPLSDPGHTDYRIEIVYLRLQSPRLALRRIAARVKQGGHNVPRLDVLRRFDRSWTNFQKSYRLLAGAWSVYDNSGRTSRLLERGP